MSNKFTSWQRLEAVINYAKMTTNAFAKSLSLKRSENLYQIKKGNNGISKELADLISDKYPEINKLWLLTGEGNMFADNNLKQGSLIQGKHSIPYYDVDLLSVIESRGIIAPNSYINIPTLSDCDFAVKFSGGAMSPVIAQGALVFAKKIISDKILYNEIYLIVTESYATIRYITKNDNDENIINLVPTNMAHQVIHIEKSEIKELYIIKGTFHQFI